MSPTPTDPQARKAVGLPPLRRGPRVPMLLLAGVVLVGLGAFLAGRELRSSEPADAAPPPDGVVHVKAPVPAGTPLSEVTAILEVRDSEGVGPDVVRQGDPIDGLVVAVDLPAGAPLTHSSLRPATVRERAIEIPEGTEAVAITLPFTSAGGAYVAPGDRVNVYVAEPGTLGTAPGELLQAAVEVLDVSVEVAPYRTTAVDPAVATEAVPRPSAGDVTMLLAVPSEAAGAVVHASHAAALHVTLTDRVAAP